MSTSGRRPPRRGNRARRALASGLVACLLAAAAGGCSLGVSPTEVPDLLGLPLDAAAESVVASGLRVGAVTYDAAAEGATWTIVAQSLVGESVPDAIVDLTLAGSPPIVVPDVSGMRADEACIRIEAAGFVCGPAAEAYHETLGASLVASQTPSGASLAPAGSAVTLLVSLGPKPPLSSTLRLEPLDTISGPYSPKSVVADQAGHVFAQNMIYRHTVTVFDALTREVVKTIPDSVLLSDFGFVEYPGTVRGGPVEAAVTPDGAHLYVSNYSMYGPGFSHPGDDEGGPNSGVDPSFVYRIPTDTLEIDQVIKVGSVPKFLAVTPDGRYVLVSNWISYTVSIIDAATAEVVDEVFVGHFPRGIAVSPDSGTAYVAVMGSRDIATIDLGDFSVDYLRGIGSSPRHLVMSPGGEYLYATLNGEGRLAKIALPSGEVVAKVATGQAPRSMTMAPDGHSLYVVNYESDTVSKVLTSDMSEVQELPVGHHPIGITYVDDLRQVWVSCYVGTFHVFEDR